MAPVLAAPWGAAVSRPALDDAMTGATSFPQRVFQVVWSFERFGGLERHLTELALALAERGTEVLVFTETAADPQNAYVQRLRTAGITVSGATAAAAIAERVGRLPLGPMRGFLGGAARVLRAGLTAMQPPASGSPSETTSSAPVPRSGGDPSILHILTQRHHHPVTVDLFARLDAATAAGRPDVVHVHGTQLRQSWVVAWAAARGLSSMYTEHVTIDEWGGPTDSTAVATMIAHAGVIACVSDRARQSAVRTLQGARDVAVVRHIVAGGSAAPPIRTHGPLHVVCIARLERYKGIDVLLHASATARLAGVDFRLQLAGDGSERKALMTLAQTLGLTDVVFLGALAPSAVATALHAADVMVLPSRGEGLPVAIVEAMANGRPVLATRAGGTGELVQDGVTGLLVDPERPDQLAEALARLAADRPGLQRMADAARRAWEVGGWSPDAARTQVTALYREAALIARRSANTSR